MYIARKIIAAMVRFENEKPDVTITELLVNSSTYKLLRKEADAPNHSVICICGVPCTERWFVNNDSVYISYRHNSGGDIIYGHAESLNVKPTSKITYTLTKVA